MWTGYLGRISCSPWCGQASTAITVREARVERREGREAQARGRRPGREASMEVRESRERRTGEGREQALAREGRSRERSEERCTREAMEKEKEARHLKEVGAVAGAGVGSRIKTRNRSQVGAGAESGATLGYGMRILDGDIHRQW